MNPVPVYSIEESKADSERIRVHLVEPKMPPPLQCGGRWRFRVRRAFHRRQVRL
ncbi:hypothetical protein [Amycolatopsis sp. CA-230715]|uniref:hypothetical protein n=1 Tax=Amycolatopsis sp. CA-230715 TaxID=2745196 RepID=UPI001C011CD5|nr:hypothetical protein [Amycolatopsis sp. CA-230715]QWF83217.1 hypothetical protein HUW46_06657 [Amycolatopsis sp. CA-230715]